MRTRDLVGPSCRSHLIGFRLRRLPRVECDVAIVGTGVAGCAAALAAADDGADVVLLSKDEPGESNTAYAQGGVAAVLDRERASEGDSIERHVADTIAAGHGLCDEVAVQDIVGDAADAIDFLLERGCAFDTDDDGTLSLTREGGHSLRRILHAHGDSTGREIARSLGRAVARHPRIAIAPRAFAVDLLRDDDAIAGVLYHRKGEVRACTAGATVLATGGCGRVYRETTNPDVATGDGLAMAYRAGCRVADAEFVQFHPTTLYIAGAARLLITEAMRGEGAVLKNARGEPFMHHHHEAGDLAPRDVVSRAIVAEIAASGFPHVWLDATHLDGDFLARRFPGIMRTCAAFEIDIREDWIPVHPSAHYHCGGVLTDTHGRTDRPRLFAAGEVGCTGLHGANRLASNSILEGLVVGRRAGRAACGVAAVPCDPRLEAPDPDPVPEELDRVDLERSLRALMWREVGIERSAASLERARRSLGFWRKHQAAGAFDAPRGWALQNMLLVGSLIARAAARREQSCGTHLRRDGGGQVDAAHTCLRRP